MSYYTRKWTCHTSTGELCEEPSYWLNHPEFKVLGGTVAEVDRYGAIVANYTESLFPQPSRKYDPYVVYYFNSCTEIRWSSNVDKRARLRQGTNVHQDYSIERGLGYEVRKT